MSWHRHFQGARIVVHIGEGVHQERSSTDDLFTIQADLSQ